jgi:hypothetical protein
MKYTLAVAAILGLVSAAEPVWSLRSVNDHRTDSTVQKDYGDHSTNAANARPPYQSTVELESDSDSSDSSDSDVQLGDEDEVDHSGEHFTAQQHDMLGGGEYKRVTPARFAADDDDIFMRSMIQQYANEGKNKDGSPNGSFWMGEAETRAAAREVLATHKKMTGAALDGYMAKYFPKAWAHFDVNRSGSVEVIKMPQVMRFLASDQQMYLW